MFLIQKPLFLWVETPLHAGSGTDLGIVDLPIQREKHTGFPKIEASGVKGCIRDCFEKEVEEDDKYSIDLLFGPENQPEAYAGAMGFSDARLLLFPVKSVKGVFAWITCPYVITRFKKELVLCNIEPDFGIPEKNTIPKESNIVIGENNDRIVLEEYTYVVTKDDKTTCFAEWLCENITSGIDQFWSEKIKKDIVVLPDEDFKDFVSMSTEIIARTRIDDTKGTVFKGALWYEEYLPSDSILYSLVFAAPIFKEKDEDKGLFKVTDEEIGGKGSKTIKEAEKVLDYFGEKLPSILQLGGNSTLGKGFVRTVFLGNMVEEDKNGG